MPGKAAEKEDEGGGELTEAKRRQSSLKQPRKRPAPPERQKLAEPDVRGPEEGDKEVVARCSGEERPELLHLGIHDDAVEGPGHLPHCGKGDKLRLTV